MIRVWAICIAALLALSCQKKEPAQEADHGLESPPAEPPPPSEPSEVSVDTDAPLTGQPSGIAVETVEQEPGAHQELESQAELESEAEPELESEPQRDLAAELKVAVGVPSDCVQDLAATSPTTLRINIRATVRPTGRIILPSATGEGLSDAARRCVEQRVEQVVLQPLNDSMSQTVSTLVEVERRAPTIVEGDTGVPEPQLRNVRRPLPPRPEVAPSGRPPPPPREEIPPSGRPIQEPTSRKVKGPKPRPIDGHEVDEQAKEWR